MSFLVVFDHIEYPSPKLRRRQGHRNRGSLPAQSRPPRVRARGRSRTHRPPSRASRQPARKQSQNLPDPRAWSEGGLAFPSGNSQPRSEARRPGPKTWLSRLRSPRERLAGNSANRAPHSTATENTPLRRQLPRFQCPKQQFRYVPANSASRRRPEQPLIRSRDRISRGSRRTPPGEGVWQTPDFRTAQGPACTSKSQARG